MTPEVLSTKPAAINEEVERRLRTFVNKSDFCQQGGIVTDLDGTAVHEDRGRIYLPKPVEHGLKQIYELGRPLVINSLRFPLSVIRTFGKEWYTISRAAIPCVSLNGSLLGYVIEQSDGQLVFEEISAMPMMANEIEDVIGKVTGFVEANIKDILLFYYPRDWRMGEIIWTPIPENVSEVRQKYTSASSVTAVTISKLREQMHAEQVCMIFLLINVPEDQRMAYQHTQRSNFFTHEGIDKLAGAQAMADHLKFSLDHSVGAGDTEMDRFLKGVGLALIVGAMNLKYEGTRDTMRLKDSFELGDVLFRLAGMLTEK